MVNSRSSVRLEIPAPLTTGPWPAQLHPGRPERRRLGRSDRPQLGRRDAHGLYRSDGHGWFPPRIDIPVGLVLRTSRVRCRSGRLADLVVTNHVSGEVEVLRNQGGGIRPPLQYPAGSGLSSQEETAGVAAGAFTQGGPPTS